MNEFKNFGIQPETKGFTGDKIKIERILNREIIVEAFKIEKSKFDGKGECLHLQLMIGTTNHILFSGSKNLITMIKKVDRKNFPFKTTIVKNDQQLEFT